MIYFTKGDIFWCGANALVNPVNWNGVQMQENLSRKL